MFLRKSAKSSILKAPIICCKDKKLETIIQNWCESFSCKYTDFPQILRQIGVSPTVPLLIHRSETGEILCSIEGNAEIEIVDLFMSFYNQPAGFLVHQENILKCFTIHENEVFKGSVPQVFFSGTQVELDEKKFIGNFLYSQYYITLFMHNGAYKLNIELTVPRQFSLNEQTDYYIQLQNYCLSLNDIVSVEQVYSDIVKIMQMSEHDIENSRKILVSFESIEPKNEIIGKILKFYGRLEEFFISKDGASYRFFSNGNWSYYRHGNKQKFSIHYSKEIKSYTFSLIENEEMLASTKPEDIVKAVETKISEFLNF